MLAHRLAMTRCNCGDLVKVRAGESADLRPGEKAWVVANFDTRPGACFDKFPDGVVCMIEFEDGSTLEIHEDDLDLSVP